LRLGRTLLSLNTYRPAPPSLYSQKQLSAYRVADQPADNPPHVWSVLRQSVKACIAQHRDQIILLAGESGAGKSYLTSRALDFFVGGNEDREVAAKRAVPRLAAELMPLLRAYGNAATRANPDSTRFGALYQTFLDKNGTAVGANVSCLMFEKSRVTHQGLEERNFHIFYQLLAGGPTKPAEGAEQWTAVKSFWDRVSKSLLPSKPPKKGDFFYLDGGEAMQPPTTEHTPIYTDTPKGFKPRPGMEAAPAAVAFHDGAGLYRTLEASSTLLPYMDIITIYGRITLDSTP